MKTLNDQCDDWPDRLKRLRKIMGISQRELAKEFDVTPAAVSYWEKGERTIPGPVKKLITIYEESFGMTTTKLEKLSDTWMGRTFKTTKTAADIAFMMAKNSTKTIVSTREKAMELKDLSEEAIAIKLVESLGDMKGLVMKIGQTLSYVDYSLPERMRKILRTLQDKTKPMPGKKVEDIIFEDFGKHPKDLFLDWDPNAFSAASIGQVHRATLKDGTQVVVKIQYPGIDKALRADLANTTLLTRFFQIMNFGGNHKEAIEEIRERFLDECNYKKEAENQEIFYEIFKDHDDIIVPRTFKKYSSTRVLTSEYYEGMRFHEFVETAPQEEKDRAGLIIYKCIHEAMVRHHIFNCDPHPGNYLFQDGKVIFLDFGCVKKFPEKFINEMNDAARAAYNKDFEQFNELIEKMGFVKNKSKFDYQYSYDWFRFMYSHISSDRPYRFTKDYIKELHRRLFKDNPNLFQAVMPKDYIFVNRLWLGVHSVFAELEAENNWFKEIRKLEKEWDDVEGIFTAKVN